MEYNYHELYTSVFIMKFLMASFHLLVTLVYLVHAADLAVLSLELGLHGMYM